MSNETVLTSSYEQIFSTFVVIDGPLLQRSTSVKLAEIHNQTLPLNITMAPEIPTGSTGLWSTMEAKGFGYFWSTPFNSTAPGGGGGQHPNNIWVEGMRNASGKDYLLNAPLSQVVTGCSGNCKAKAKLIAPALAVTECTSWLIPVNYSQPSAFDVIEQNPNRAPPLDANLFMQTGGLVVDSERETIDMITAYTTISGPDCVGTLNVTACTLESAIGEYDISIADNVVSLDSPEDPTIVALANNSNVSRDFVPALQAHMSTLAGIVYIWTMFHVASSYESVLKGQMSILSTNILANLPYEHANPENPECASYSDPHLDVLGYV